MACETHSLNTSTPRIPHQDTIGRDDQVPKRLFIFCDGTWQDGVNNNRRLTNVATLARCLDNVSNDNYIQIVHYDSGIGNVTSTLSRLIDGAIGRAGISVKISNAYSFLSHNYNFSHEKDEIFLVGFSRGAFTVQCLASFISQTGLFQKQHLYYLRGLFSFALGFPSPWPRPLSFVGKEIPNAVENAFQVLALDENRTQFEPCVWNSKESTETYAKQCWFLGSHGDVGGNGDAVLGAVTLIWTIGQLQTKTNVSFNKKELMRHLKHRFLEWDVHINEFLGQIKETAILSDIPNSVHFTVRFALAEGRNKSQSIRMWTTETQDDGTVRWRLGDKILLEDRVSNNRNGNGYKEYKIFNAWRNKEFPPEETDRTTFAAYVRALIQDEREELCGNLDSFASFLKRTLKFEDEYLAPDIMYLGRP
ncbi:hypothetical protein K449DRAFT_459349 [Hypoxylon sp. EC38]|nr:hypothetical protein K449DRAFT_459349 [Hypoxylon sp. EC38]